MAAPEPCWEGGPLYTPAEILARPCPIPTRPGVYGWFFATIPPGIDAAGTYERDGLRLLYAGISPRRATSTQTLRSRLRAHCRGDAYGSTLRLTVGCLLADELGIELRRIGSGARETFGPGEAVLSEWIARNMRVSFREDDEPWVAEAAIIGALDLPLNIEQNAQNPQRGFVRDARRRWKDHARRRPVLGQELDANKRSYDANVRFLERHDDGPAGQWWEAVAAYPSSVPGIVGELLRDSRSVVCDAVEAEQAMAWARAHPAWTDDPPPLVLVDPAP